MIACFGDYATVGHPGVSYIKHMHKKLLNRLIPLSKNKEVPSNPCTGEGIQSELNTNADQYNMKIINLRKESKKQEDNNPHQQIIRQ